MMDLLNLFYDFLSPGREIVINGVICQLNQAIAPLLVAGIAAGISALASGGSAIAGARANKKNQKILDQQSRENEQMYLQEYYRGALDNEGSKAYLKRLDEIMEKRDKAADNAAVATGATQENQLAAKQANNEVMSDAISGLIEREEQYKRAAQDRYFNVKNNLQAGKMSQNQAVAQNWANIGAGISNAAGSLASAYLLSGDYKLNPTAGTTTTNPAQTTVK